MELLALFNTIMNTDYESEDVVVETYFKKEYLDLLASPDLLYFEGMCVLTNSSYQDKHTGDAYRLLNLVSSSFVTGNTRSQYIRNSAIQNLRYTEVVLNGIPRGLKSIPIRGTAKKYEEPPHTLEKLEKLRTMSQGYLNSTLKKFKPFEDFLLANAIKTSEVKVLRDNLRSFGGIDITLTTEEYNVDVKLNYPYNGVLCLLCTFEREYFKRTKKPFLYKEQKERVLTAMESRLSGYPDLFNSFKEKVYFDLPFYVKPIEELIGDIEELKTKVYNLHAQAKISLYLALKEYEKLAQQVLFVIYTSIVYEDRSHFAKSMYLLEALVKFRNKYTLI